MVDILIKRVIDGDIDEVALPMTPIRDIDAILQKEGFDVNNADRDTNGWQVDFWNTYTHKELGKFMLSGSWYGGQYRFSKYKEDNE